MSEGVMKNNCSKGSPGAVEKQRKRLNRRQKARLLLIFSVAFLAATAIFGVVLHDAAMVTDFSRKNIAPCLKYPFGTDWLGRNMFYRTLTGLSMSILIGVLAAGVSAIMALILGICAATLGKKVDSAISFAIDTVMGIPHILLLILISYAMGKGLKGVIAGVALTHWTSLARLIRGEVMQLRESEYIQIAGKLGLGKWEIAKKHIVPHVLPQFIVGLNYYTGAIFEVKALDVQIGSITGGGRYDNLTGVFGMAGVSGVGISFGADRIFDVLNQLELYPKEAVNGTELLFINFGEKEAAFSMGILSKVRAAGIRAEIFPDAAKMKKQMSYANTKNIPFVAIVGENEMNEGKAMLKNMETGEQNLVSAEELIATVKK